MDSQLDVMLLTRGIIAGAISISINPSSYLNWAAVVNGIIAGGLFVLSLKMVHLFEFDDATHVTQTHGFMALYSMISICFFHKTEGFLFK